MRGVAHHLLLDARDLLLELAMPSLERTDFLDQLFVGELNQTIADSHLTSRDVDDVDGAIDR
ncbi:MAG: hypothetical protein R3B96_13465 [Pirellulaceae bacterium]